MLFKIFRCKHAPHSELETLRFNTSASHFASHAPQAYLLQLLQEQLPQLSRFAVEAIPGLSLRFREMAEDDLDGRAVIELFWRVQCYLVDVSFSAFRRIALVFSRLRRTNCAQLSLNNLLGRKREHVPSSPRRWRWRLP